MRLTLAITSVGKWWSRFGFEWEKENVKEKEG